MNKPTGKLAFAYATISRHEQTIAALRQQLEEAQRKLKAVTPQVQPASPERTSECLVNERRAILSNPAEQRLADAEKQEPVAWGIPNSRPTERNPLMQVLLDKTGCQYPELLIPLVPQHSQPAAADARVKALEALLEKYGAHTRSCSKVHRLAISDYLCICGFDAALAASKGEKA